MLNVTCCLFCSLFFFFFVVSLSFLAASPYSFVAPPLPSPIFPPASQEIWIDASPMATLNLISLMWGGFTHPGNNIFFIENLNACGEMISSCKKPILPHRLDCMTLTTPIWYYGLSDIPKAKGVAIGFWKGTAFILVDTLVDPFGRFIFLKDSLGNLQCTLANFYAPNQGQAMFLTATLNKLKEFAHGCIVLARDFIIPLEPTLDTFQGKSCVPHRRLPFIRKQIHKAQLMDVWRIIHPREKDYTHYSSLHSPIDYFLLSHHHLEIVSKTRIEISTTSDHAHSITLQISSLPVKSRNWKFNDSLITEEVDIKEIGSSLSLLPGEYFWNFTWSSMGGP